MKMTVVLIPNDNGSYTARVPSIPGCISQGSTKGEALKNIREAIELSLEAVDDDLNLEPNALVEEIEIREMFLTYPTLKLFVPFSVLSLLLFDNGEVIFDSEKRSEMEEPSSVLFQHIVGSSDILCF